MYIHLNLLRNITSLPSSVPSSNIYVVAWAKLIEQARSEIEQTDVSIQITRYLMVLLIICSKMVYLDGSSIIRAFWSTIHQYCNMLEAI